MVSQGGHLLTWALATPQHSWAVTPPEVTPTSGQSPGKASSASVGKGGWVPACSCIHCALELEMPRKSHVLVLALAQPVGRAVWAVALLQSEGPTTCRPFPPISGRSLHSWFSMGITESRLSSSPLGPGADLAPAA